jgi:hypothetical protein
VGRSYKDTVTATGGTTPYSFIGISGSLPPGLKLISRGVVSGKPTSAGTFTFAIQAKDLYGRLGTRQYNLTIALPAISLKSSDPLPSNGRPVLQQGRYSERLQ